MNIFKKLFAFFLCCCLILSLMTACSAGSSSETAQTDPTETPDATETPVVTAVPTEDAIVLYDGCEISTITGVRNVNAMTLTKVNSLRYNRDYYNYEDDACQGQTTGTLVEGSYEGEAVVEGVSHIAISNNDNAIPRSVNRLDTLPDFLQEMTQYSTIDALEADLDGDGTDEYLVAITIQDGTETATSAIDFLQSDGTLIAELVSLEDGFWAGIHEDGRQIYLNLDDVDVIDIDGDDAMEILIKIPTYDSYQLSIYKYANSTLTGDAEYAASVMP